jgi:tubulin polyglutamylase TTLL4
MAIDYDEIFSKIKDIVIKTLISVENVMGGVIKKTTFEIYGFDILLDSKYFNHVKFSLKPWIMEVNVQPSLSSSSPLDRKIKH